MNVYKIVFTGGPCSGKTTLIKSISKELKELGYTVFTVSETARDFIENGITSKQDKAYTLKFQNAILQAQLNKENITESFAKDSSLFNKTIILYDRGILDNKAYLKDENDFEEMLNNNKMGMFDAVERYDMVINLISLASLDDFDYVNDNARTESKEESRQLDIGNTYAWLLHRNLKIVMPTKDINDKKTTIMSYILNSLQQKKIIEDEIKSVGSEEYNRRLKCLKQFMTFYTIEYYLKTLLEGKIYKITSRKYKKENQYILETYNEYNNTLYNYESRVLNEKQFNKIVNAYDWYTEGTKINNIYINNFQIQNLRESDYENEILTTNNNINNNNHNKQKIFVKSC